jgi:nicotinate-nucleotide--dimethylbenzimidazole phosphoribosyltransferase
VDDATWRRKVAVVERALAVNRPDGADGVDVLARVGGFEIAGLAGVVLAGAAYRIPIFLDGFIAGAAALAAARITPAARHYVIAAHRSVEPGHAHALAALGLVGTWTSACGWAGTGAALGIGPRAWCRSPRWPVQVGRRVEASEPCR